MAQHTSAVPQALTRGYSNAFISSLCLPAPEPALTQAQLAAMDQPFVDITAPLPAHIEEATK